MMIIDCMEYTIDSYDEASDKKKFLDEFRKDFTYVTGLDKEIVERLFSHTVSNKPAASWHYAFMLYMTFYKPALDCMNMKNKNS